MTQKNEYKPEILNEIEAKKLKKQKHIIFVDAFSYQVKELFIIKNPQYSGESKEEGYKTKDFKDFLKEME
jgi:hypothetical protein